MPQINLLPWREQLRKEKIKGFLQLTAFFIIGTLGLIIFFHLYLNHHIQLQQQRTAYLTSVIGEVKKQLLELQQKQKKVVLLEEELKFLFSQRDNSFQAVRLLDNLPKVTPDEVSLSNLNRKGNIVMIYGTAKSTLQVTHFMKNIVQSNIFDQPELSEISTKKNVTGDERYFQLKIIQFPQLDN